MIKFVKILTDKIGREKDKDYCLSFVFKTDRNVSPFLPLFLILNSSLGYEPVFRIDRIKIGHLLYHKNNLL